MEIREAQRRVWENKIAKGFNTSDVPLEFMLLHGEVAESFDAWQEQDGTLGEELADVAIYVLSLAQINGIDLDAEIEAKIAKNARRVYERAADGVLRRVDPS